MAQNEAKTKNNKIASEISVFDKICQNEKIMEDK